MTRLDLVIENKLNVIYCSATGLPIGTMAESELEAFIEAEEAVYGFNSDNDFLDHLQLAMIPICSRPSPVFQNMSPLRYRALAANQPIHMTRYLLGRVVFDRWNHLTGITQADGKEIWLRDIELREGVDELLDALIRLDAIISLRRVYLPLEITKELKEIRAEWPGYPAMRDFIFRLEAINIKRLATYSAVISDGAFEGNRLAKDAMLDQMDSLDPEELAQALTARKAAELLRTSRAESKAKENLRRIARGLKDGGTSVQIKRGIQAIMDFAVTVGEKNGTKIDKALALRMMAKSDTSRIKPIEKSREKEAAARLNKVKVSTRKPKVEFSLDFGNDDL